MPQQQQSNHVEPQKIGRAKKPAVMKKGFYKNIPMKNVPSFARPGKVTKGKGYVEPKKRKRNLTRSQIERSVQKAKGY